jgi:hypothetical protein
MTQIAYLVDGVLLEATSYKALVAMMHKQSHAPANDDVTWMLQVRDRTEVQSGAEIRVDTYSNFVHDLAKAGLIKESGNDQG